MKLGKMRLVIGGAVVSAALVASALSVLYWTGVRSAAAQVGPQDQMAVAKGLGIEFAPVAVTSGARPELPNAQLGITADEAGVVARKVAPGGVDATGNILPGVTVSSEYGLFTDNHRGWRQASGAIIRQFVDRPVWIVTFSGTGVVIDMSGPKGSGVVHHEITAVVDAATGQYLMGYSYQ